MGVSDTHINLVKAMASWVKQNCHPNEYALMLLDLPETIRRDNPPLIGGYIPDLYIKSVRMIIGEAKTSQDIETKHSREQYTQYLKHLKQYRDSLFIMAVPWYCVPLTKSLILRVQKNINAVNVKMVILDKLPG
jgi:hypothetical protein